jgi:hypothetical protein
VSALAKLAYWEGLLFLGGFCAVVAWKLLTGAISLEQLFYGDSRDGNVQFSPGRVQILIVTLFVALNYMTQVIQHPTGFPEIPQAWLAGMGASHLAYLSGKTHAMIFDNNRQ